MSKATRWIALSVVCAAVAGVAATAAIARTAAIITVTTAPTPPLATALDDGLFQTTQRLAAFTKASAAGAKYARILVAWQDIAPGTLPKKWSPGDPATLCYGKPCYKWTSLDATVAAAALHGVQPIFDIVSPPGWAYDVKPSGWTGGRPKVAQLGLFAKALARRYNGTPGGHGTVRAYSVWNEPNFNRNLFPQNAANPNFTAEGYYRQMVNAVADAVHSVNPLNLALAGELAPFKHTPSGTDKNNVIPPLDFMRAMLCLSNTVPIHLTCAAHSAHFDVWTHHPYSDTGPFGHARAAGGVELGDLPKMKALLNQAVKLGAIASAKPAQFWVTEIGWSTKPPNKLAVPMALETRWLPESLYQTWKSGATLATWYELQDKPLTTPFQSGLYYISKNFNSAVAKPLLASFRLPFVAYLKPGGKVYVWGRDVTSDAQTVTISMKAGSSWKIVASIKTNAFGIFQALLPLNAKSTYMMRAGVNGVTSSPFALAVPSNENLQVTPFPLVTR